jgi:uncharacterized protein YndB with AHSA1/START domain
VTDPIRHVFDVECPPEHAFATWAERTSLWWPAGHTVSAEDGLEVVYEPRAGGRIFERTASGDEHDWGEVIAWDPPRRLAYLWHLRQDRADATEVEITFTGSEAGPTRVEIEHRGWERLGAGADDKRDRNLRGWAGLLPHYVEVCSRRGAPWPT